MDKIFLIFQREYLTRVRKKSFIIMTILTPVLFGMMIFFVAWFSTKKGDAKTIEVLDNSGLFKDKFENSDNLNFVFIGSEKEEAKKKFRENESFGLLIIPKLNIDSPSGIEFFSEQNPSFDLVNNINKQIAAELRHLRIEKLDLNDELIASLDVSVDTKTYNISSEKESNAGVNFGIGYIASFLIYMFIFLYGAQVMRGVIEEKTSRIVEVVISSVKPFQLMLGKVLGVATVGLTQFVIWIILMLAVSTFVTSMFGPDSMSSMGNVHSAEIQEQMQDQQKVTEIMQAVQNTPVFQIISLFVFYFLGGYLLYAALFAMVGSAVDSEADSQQFMLPITIPLLLAIFSLAPVLSDPNGQLAFWLSMIPFTSPVVMMGRIAYGVPFWQIALSMFLLICGFIFTTWFAARVYRVGILIHGTKVNYKVLMKWFMQS